MKSLSPTSRTVVGVRVRGKRTLGQLISVHRFHPSRAKRQCSDTQPRPIPRRLSLSAFPRRPRPSRPRSQSSSYPYFPRESYAEEPFPQSPSNARSTSPRRSSGPRENRTTDPNFHPFPVPVSARWLPARDPTFQEDQRHSAPPIATPSTTGHRLRGGTSCVSRPAGCHPVPQSRQASNSSGYVISDLFFGSLRIQALCRSCLPGSFPPVFLISSCVSQPRGVHFLFLKLLWQFL